MKVNVYVEPAVPVHIRFVNFAIPATAVAVNVPVKVQPDDADTVTVAVLLETVPLLASPIAIHGWVANKEPEDPPTAACFETNNCAEPLVVSEFESIVNPAAVVNVRYVLPEAKVKTIDVKVATPEEAVAVTVPESVPEDPLLIAAVTTVVLLLVTIFPAASLSCIFG